MKKQWAMITWKTTWHNFLVMTKGSRRDVLWQCQQPWIFTKKQKKWKIINKPRTCGFVYAKVYFLMCHHAFPWCFYSNMYAAKTQIQHPFVYVLTEVMWQIPINKAQFGLFRKDNGKCRGRTGRNFVFRINLFMHVYCRLPHFQPIKTIKIDNKKWSDKPHLID